MLGHDLKAHITQGAPICEAFAAQAVQPLAFYNETARDGSVTCDE
jgi:hypothetical protein